MKPLYAFCVFLSNFGLLLCGYGWWKERFGIVFAGLVCVFTFLLFLVYASQRITAKTGIRSPQIFRTDDHASRQFLRRIYAYMVSSIVVSTAASSIAGVCLGVIWMSGILEVASIASLFSLAIFANGTFLLNLAYHLDWALLSDDGTLAIQRVDPLQLEIQEPVFVVDKYFRWSKRTAEAWYVGHGNELFARYPTEFLAIGENGVIAIGEKQHDVERTVLQMIAAQRQKYPDQAEKLACIVRSPGLSRKATRILRRRPVP